MPEYDDYIDGELSSMDSPTDFDEHVMNEDDCAPGDGPQDENEEYQRDDGYDGQPDEAQEWHDFDPDC